MILDSLLMFDNTLVMVAGTTGAIGTTVSTNVLDLHGAGLIPTLASGQGARDIGIGDNPAMKISSQVVTTLTSGGAATLVVALQGAPDNGAGAPGTYTTYTQSQAYALATLVGGARLLDQDMPRPPAGITYPRFLRMSYTIATATFTGGAIESGLVLDRQDWISYPAGINISN